MFEPDSGLASRMAEAAERVAREERSMGRRLDFSRASVAELEAFAARESGAGRHQRELEVIVGYRDRFIEAAGAYLGETIRRNLGGEWGWDSLDGRRTAVLRIADGALVADPAGKLRRRIELGPDENLESYYYMAEHWHEIAIAFGDGTPPSREVEAAAESAGFRVDGLEVVD